MLNGLPKRAKIGLHGAFHRLGFDVVPYSGRYFGSKLRTETLRKLGIRTVIDVGANEGQYAMEIRADGWGGAIISLEPLPQPFARLARRAHHDVNWTVLNKAAGDRAGSFAINLTHESPSSSFLEPTQLARELAADFEVTRRVIVDVVTLDEAISALDVVPPFHIKADTQGSELSVLRGATATLNDTASVEIELSYRELYRGQGLIAETTRWLLDNGFVPFALAPSFIVDGKVVQTNGLFLRRTA